jgi:serine/threonine protein kinase
MRLLLCIGRAVARKGLKTLAEAIPFGNSVFEIAEEAWKEYQKSPGAGPVVADVHQLAAAPAAAVRESVSAVVLEVAAQEPPEVRAALADYLTQVPSVVRRTLSRPSDPRGHTVPNTRSLQTPEDLLPFLPPRLPRFRAGDQPLAGTNWVLQDLLGVGGFGEVWKAHDPEFQGLVVALKFCLDQEAARTLLVHEASNLDRIMRHGRHPGIVALRAVHRKSEPICLEYDYVEGGDLGGLIADRKERGEFPPAESARWILQLASALQFAHELRPPLVHRDLKPSNILVQRDGTRGACSLKIADFGISALAAGQAIADATHGATSRGETAALTLRGACTPLYASPQQLQGKAPDSRDDVHALGVIWYQMLSGDLTRGRPSGSSWRKHLSARGMSEPLMDVLDRCLDDDPSVRPDDAGVLYRSLDTALRLNAPSNDTPPLPSGEPFPRRRLPRQVEVVTMAGQGTLRMVRVTGPWMGRLVSFSVFIDGQPAGKLAYGEEISTPLSAGMHKVKVSGGGSFFGAEQDVMIVAGQVYTLTVGYTGLGGIRLTAG